MGFDVPRVGGAVFSSDDEFGSVNFGIKGVDDFGDLRRERDHFVEMFVLIGISFDYDATARNVCDIFLFLVALLLLTPFIVKIGAPRNPSRVLPSLIGKVHKESSMILFSGFFSMRFF